MSAVFERELRSYFQNITGWLFLAAYIVVYDIYYFYYNLYSGYPYISYPLSSIIMIMLILIPILTMRSMAEDRKSKTNQLLYTAPVSVSEIVLGKYLAMASVYTIAMIFTCVTPIILRMFGEVPFAANYTAVFGMWLFGLMAIAIGLFISSLTESQIIAAVLSFAVLIIGYLMNTFATIIVSTQKVLIAIMKGLAITDPLGKFNNAVFSLTGAVYYITIAAFFIFITCVLIDMKRGRGRGLVMIIAAFAVLVLVNVGFSHLPDKYTEIDTSANKVFELSDTTYDFLKTVDQDVDIYVWGDKDDVQDTIIYTLDRYDSASKHIRVEYVDPLVSPTFYQDYMEVEPETGTLIVVGKGRYKVIKYADLLSYGMQGSNKYVSGYDGEGKITGAVNYVLGAETMKVYAISGHGENALDASFINEMEKQNYQVETISLVDTEMIPEDAKGIIINGPSSDYSKDEMDLLKKYFGNGGKALITLNYKAPYLDRLYDYLADTYNMEIHNGMVFEGDSSFYYNQPMYIFPTVIECDLTENISRDNHILIPYSRAISMGNNVNKVVYTELMYTTEAAYMKANISNLKDFTKKEGDIEGKQVLGVNVIDHATEADITVIGSYIAFTDDADGVVAGNNLRLFSGITAAFSDGSESRLAIPAKSYSVGNLSTSKSVSYALFGILVFLIPLILLVIGVVIWIRRRKK